MSMESSSETPVATLHAEEASILTQSSSAAPDPPTTRDVRGESEDIDQDRNSPSIPLQQVLESPKVQLLKFHEDFEESAFKTQDLKAMRDGEVEAAPQPPKTQQSKQIQSFGFMFQLASQIEPWERRGVNEPVSAQKIKERREQQERREEEERRRKEEEEEARRRQVEEDWRQDYVPRLELISPAAEKGYEIVVVGANRGRFKEKRLRIARFDAERIPDFFVVEDHPTDLAVVDHYDVGEFNCVKLLQNSSSDGRFLAIGRWWAYDEDVQSQVLIVDYPSGDIVRKLVHDRSGYPVNAIQAIDGTNLVVSGDQMKLSVSDWKTGEKKLSFGSGVARGGLDYLREENVLLAGWTIREIDMGERLGGMLRCYSSRDGVRSEPNVVAYGPPGSHVFYSATGRRGTFVRIWDRRTREVALHVDMELIPCPQKEYSGIHVKALHPCHEKEDLMMVGLQNRIGHLSIRAGRFQSWFEAHRTSFSALQATVDSIEHVCGSLYASVASSDDELATWRLDGKAHRRIHLGQKEARFRSLVSIPPAEG